MKHTIAGFIFVLIAVSGCHPVNTIEKKDPVARPVTEETKKLIYDPSLGHRLQATSVYIDDSAGLLRVQANVLNNAGSPCAVKYRFEWFNQKGMSISDSTEGWTRITLAPGETSTLGGVASSPEAVDWKLQLQSWKQ